MYKLIKNHILNLIIKILLLISLLYSLSIFADTINLNNIIKDDIKNNINELNKLIFNKDIIHTSLQENYLLNKILRKKKIELYNDNIKFLLNQNKLKSLFIKKKNNIKLIISKIINIKTLIIDYNKLLKTFKKQQQWLDTTNILIKDLRNKIKKKINFQNNKKIYLSIPNIFLEKLQYENIINQINILNKNFFYKENNFTKIQKKNITKKINNQIKILKILIDSCNIEIYKINELKRLENKLNILKIKIKKYTHKYLFWLPDLDLMHLNYISTIQNIFKNILILKKINISHKILISYILNTNFLIFFFILIIFIILNIIIKQEFFIFIDFISKKIGKVSHDKFSFTLKVTLLSLLISLPFPMLFYIFGYNLYLNCKYLLIKSLGISIIKTSPMLFILFVIKNFTEINGLFVAHFNWSIDKIKKKLKYFNIIYIIVYILLIISIILDNYKEKNFLNEINRILFIFICICLLIAKNNFKYNKVLWILDKLDYEDNNLNEKIWNLIIFFNLLLIIISYFGYLAIAKYILFKLEVSIIIWFSLKIIYHIIRRLMIIQCRRISFERAKQLREEKLAQRSRDEDLIQNQLNEVDAEIDSAILDLDDISYKSLQLVKSIIALINTILLILNWIDIHPTFYFLEKITLWDINKNIPNSIDIIKPITLNSILVTILVVIITLNMVRNLPSLLELVLLQNLNLKPGTGFAINTLTKYILIIIGSFVSFSLIGIKWSTLQWLMAALGFGLGFGLQEIFANFISGIIILFERPIRIGDTVTIKQLTGAITKISIRATTIIDLDHKEIIIPNKVFITEQFINWSLSDSITRILLIVPSPPDSNAEQISSILIEAAKQCPLVLDFPTPEVYLIDLKDGIPIFELRLFAAEMGHRMPLKHHVNLLILEQYKKFNLNLPFPTFKIYKDKLKFNKNLSKYKFNFKKK